MYGDSILLEEQFRQNFDSTRHLTLEKNYGQAYCFGLCQEPGISETEPVLLVGKLIRQMDTLEKAGYLYVAVDQTHLQTLYGEQKLTRGQQVYVCGQNGAVLSSSQENMIGENLGIAMDGQAGSRLIWRQGALWMCQKIPMDDLQAEIVILIPFYELYSSSILSVLLLFDCHRLWYPCWHFGSPPVSPDTLLRLCRSWLKAPIKFPPATWKFAVKFSPMTKSAFSPTALTTCWTRSTG